MSNSSAIESILSEVAGASSGVFSGGVSGMVVGGAFGLSFGGGVAAIFSCLECLASESDPEESFESDFLGQVRELWPGRPQMLHFLDMVE